ncbi:rod shape-determining protein MreC [Pelagibacterales bacterium SAG-MED18]|nr:rod shape-determining protein MreC [Pelagibacterales bacterium SAG-MED18]MBD1159426.1 rod shape-determining protein MreC [Pelagibacterales bacterium SAG-MED19]MBD1165591.1 rod shape-determining protein MreC [Pelagibacterales bacterium SAG-MED10]
MASSRDDFIIAIRSAFLKKSTQQKFSLLTLVFISVFIIVLSSLELKVIKFIKVGINEFVYRSSFVVSIPENLLISTFSEISEYTTFFNKYKKNKDELDQFKSKNISNEIILNENKELKELINNYVSSSDKLLAKIIVDHNSPFLKSIIINKGSKDDIKIGTNIYDQSYLVGRVIEVNYKSSRVLLLSDLNSNVPVTIAPQNIQAIITGIGDNNGKIKYIKDGLSEKLENDSIVYTSGTGAIFKSGVPIGKLKILKNEISTELKVQFYSDFSQLKYVFAEILTNTPIQNLDNENTNNQKKNPIDAKVQILEDEIEIIEDTNVKFKEENENLKVKINDLNDQVFDLNNEITRQKEKINQFDLDKEELEFLRLNLIYSHKCQTKKLFSTGFKVGTPEYKKCILNKGKKVND